MDDSKFMHRASRLFVTALPVAPAYRLEGVSASHTSEVALLDVGVRPRADAFTGFVHADVMNRQMTESFVLGLSICPSRASLTLLRQLGLC